MISLLINYLLIYLNVIQLQLQGSRDDKPFPIDDEKCTTADDFDFFNIPSSSTITYTPLKATASIV